MNFKLINILYCIGNRKGLAGEKSSLFFQAIRIIREMREATNGLFPAIAVWENVMGAFSSNDRMDFRAVLSAFTDTDVSMPASGRWAGAGMVRGRTPDLCWRLMDAQHWASPRLARRQRIFLVADFGGRRSHEILFKPRTMQSLPAFGGDRGLPAACGDRGSFIEAGRRVPVTRPFQCFRMRASAKERTETAFRNSFGLPTDPFPTLLAGGVTPFAFWYEDDPAGGCVRFPTETECERLMGLPEGWTRYGADGEEILSSHRYRALGNAIALPCAEYIMAGGNTQIILCERGIRTFETYTRNTLDLSAIPAVKKLSHLPVIVDPSHAAGLWWMVEPMAKAAVAAGADGLIIEVHNDPEHALCDGAQSLKPERFARLMGELSGIAKIVGREL